jgi:diguanylate cyclase (GGDEF)-like protein
LSGLANRRGFDRQLEREWQIAAEHRKPIALMMVDIDHFKLFNERYGHVAGDTCLRAVGETLSLVTLEEAALVARYGGEEFAVLLPGLPLDRAAALAQEARKRRRPSDQPFGGAMRPCHREYRRGVRGAGEISDRRRIG